MCTASYVSTSPVRRTIEEAGGVEVAVYALDVAPDPPRSLARCQPLLPGHRPQLHLAPWRQHPPQEANRAKVIPLANIEAN